MTKYVYHLRRSTMQGSILHPLNQLKSIYPDAFADQVKKYEGREWLMERIIPPLNCLWNDVLHFSPVSPQLIIDAFKREGLIEYIHGFGYRTHGEYFKIPVDLISNDRSTYFQNLNEARNQLEPNSTHDWKFWPFSPNEYEEQTEISKLQIEQWHAAKKIGKPLLWFSHTTHILARQTIDVSDCEIIKCG